MAAAMAGKATRAANRVIREEMVRVANVRPRNSSVTFSCSMVYPVTQVRPTARPMGTVSSAASVIVGMAATTNRHPAVPSIPA